MGKRTKHNGGLQDPLLQCPITLAALLVLLTNAQICAIQSGGMRLTGRKSKISSNLTVRAARGAECAISNADANHIFHSPETWLYLQTVYDVIPFQLTLACVLGFFL